MEVSVFFATGKLLLHPPDTPFALLQHVSQIFQLIATALFLCDGH
jgi:hypothetical protein